MNILILALILQDPTIEELEARALAWGVQRRLEITDEQAKTLLDLAKQADVARVEYEARLATLRKEQVKAFTAFREEDIKNVGFTPSVERNAGAAEHQEKVLGKAYADRIEAIAKKAPLTEEQITLLGLYRPGKLEAIFVKLPPLRPELAQFVRKLRSKSAAEFERQHETLRDEFLRVIGARTSEVDDLASFLASIDEAMKQIRALAEDRVDRDVPRIVRKASPKTREEELREGLGEIHKQKYGEIGPVGKLLLLPAMIETLSKRLGVKAEKNPTPTGAKSDGG